MLIALLLAGTGCGDATTADGFEVAQPRTGCADIINATADLAADGSWSFTATVASADTGWDKYADAWEVRSLNGEVLGTRVLAHPHPDEQPFTRSLSSVAVPDDLDEVDIVAHDSVEGFCGKAYRLTLRG